ncbi:peroxiredoxin family protein [Streptomyces anthocyanicus]|uniref:peroxiredoxin family protein n=1 Tax=Streptomyces TaxID=1883 RepID=UPI00368CEB26
MTTLYVVCGALAVAVCANLVLTIRLARAVRRDPADPPAELDRPDTFSLPVGHELPPFEATSFEGRPVGAAAMDEYVVGFFMIGCPPCQAAVDDYAALAGRLADSGIPAIAVVRHEPHELDRPAARHELDAETERLSRTAVVVHEEGDGSIITAFGVSAYPLFYRVRREGRGHVVVAEAPTTRHFRLLELV